LENHHGLLWIKGKPGSGKLTLMREAFRYAEQQKTGKLLHSMLLLQWMRGRAGTKSSGSLSVFNVPVVPQSRDTFRKFLALYRRMDKNESERALWHVGVLKSFFQSAFMQTGMQRTIIFIDALDECTGEGMRDLAYFFRNVTTSAHKAGVELNICLSSRHYPTVTIRLCPEVIVEDFNGPDMTRYVEQRLAAGDISSDSQWAHLVREILEKSSGVSLWLVLVVDILLKDRDNGKNIKHLENRIRQVPRALEISSQEMHTTIRFFQWALLARRTLRLREWHHVLALINGREPGSLSEWRGSEDYTENGKQFRTSFPSPSATSRAMTQLVLILREANNYGEGTASFEASKFISRGTE
jgi:protein SERAC1